MHTHIHINSLKQAVMKMEAKNHPCEEAPREKGHSLDLCDQLKEEYSSNQWKSKHCSQQPLEKQALWPTTKKSVSVVVGRQNN